MDFSQPWTREHLLALRSIALRAARRFNTYLDDSAIDDLAQEVGLRLRRYLATHDPEVAPWEARAMRIARNLAIDWRRRPRHTSLEALEGFEPPGDTDEAGRNEDAELDAAAAGEAFKSLSAAHRARFAAENPSQFPPDEVARDAFRKLFGLSWEEFLRNPLTLEELAARLNRTVNSVFDQPRKRARELMASYHPRLAKYRANSSQRVALAP